MNILSDETQDTPRGNEAPQLEVLGPFKLIELLGRGGMGAVYLAEQDHPRRRVALKLMRSELVGSDDLRRFTREAGFLAKLAHPAIARVLEAGHVRGALGPIPYLAMEYVQGTGLIRHAAALSPVARIRLLADICRAVQHAHARGVIHRDLKPDNILVDSNGLPKILDFGIAKAVEAEDDDPTAPHTMAGHVIGTPNYMSPEQLAGAAIDPRTDVYSLGAIAYEVLSGARVREFAGQSLAEAQAALHLAPTRLANRAPATRGDIDTIVMKALAAEPERRYQSAAELADDFERYLTRRPILARPPSFAYSAGRYLVRNWLALSVAGIVVASLLGATLVSLGFAKRAERARAEAETQAAVAREVNGFLRSMLSAANPRASADRPTTLLDMVDRARDALAQRNVSAAVELEIRRTLLDTYRGLSQSEQALAQAEVILAHAQSIEAQIEAQLHRAALLGELQRQTEVAATLTTVESLIAQLATVPPESARKLALERARWHTRDGRFNEALTAFDEALAMASGELRRDDPEQFPIRADRLNVLADLGQINAAMTEFDALIADVERVQGADHPETLILRNDRATLFHGTGATARAAAEMETIAADAARVFGPDHEFTLTTLHNLAAVEIGRGKRQRALELLSEKRRRMQGRYAPDHLKLINTESSLAVVAAQLGDADGAEAIYVDVLKRWPETKSGFPAEIATALFNLARLRADQKRWPQARADFETLIRRMEQAKLSDSVSLARYRVEFASLLLIHENDVSAARRQLDFAHAKIERELPVDHPSHKLADQVAARLGESF